MARATPHHTPLASRIASLSEQPGVYLFTDAQHRVIYVGKAARLRARVSSYFRGPARLSPRIATLVPQIADVEVRPTATEAEALLLEAQLIKTHRPPYNVAFRDDKSYPMLKITREPFPRLLVTRRRLADGARYFGRYPDAGLMHEAVRFLRRVFPMRTCRTFPKTPCLEYHIGQCLAPCVGYISETDYQRIVEDLAAFLEGKRDALLRDLSRRMAQASAHRQYEQAARLRDQIQALTSVIAAKAKSATAGPLEQLQTALSLPVLPRRIEAFDISNLFGQHAVGSMVTFVDGRPHRAHYRQFNIETVAGIDDYQMMQEVIRRRYAGSLAEQLPRPDLILVDGGKGQLGAALEALQAATLSIPTVGLAKQQEQLFVPGQRDPIVLLPTSPVLHLVQHVRDEAHRVAIRAHRRRRARPIRASALDQIAGVGPKRKALLFSQFGSIDRLRRATPEAVAAVARISLAHAQRVVQQLNT